MANAEKKETSAQEEYNIEEEGYRRLNECVFGMCRLLNFTYGVKASLKRKPPTMLRFEHTNYEKRFSEEKEMIEKMNKLHDANRKIRILKNVMMRASEHFVKLYFLHANMALWCIATDDEESEDESEEKGKIETSKVMPENIEHLLKVFETVELEDLIASCREYVEAEKV